MATPRKSADTGIKVEMLALADIAPYANNPKGHPDPQVAEIAASVAQFGFVNPILLDAGNTIIAGHGRLAAAHQIGLKKVPVIRLAHLTADQAKALRIADNAIPAGGIWDADLLEAELASLRAVKFDLEPLGLEDIQLPELDEEPTPPPKVNRSKTTIFVSIKNEDLAKARKTIIAALDKARIHHNL